MTVVKYGVMSVCCIIWLWECRYKVRMTVKPVDTFIVLFHWEISLSCFVNLLVQLYYSPPVTDKVLYLLVKPLSSSQNSPELWPGDE